MRIYNVTLSLLVHTPAGTDDEHKKEMYVLGDDEDPRTFADTLYSTNASILRFDAEEVDQTNLKVSKNALAPYKKRYFNEN
jgi:hypothetical protein